MGDGERQVHSFGLGGKKTLLKVKWETALHIEKRVSVP